MSNYQQFRILKSNACSLVGRPQKGMRKPKEPLTFEKWFLIGVRRMERERRRIHFLISWPGQNRMAW